MKKLTFIFLALIFVFGAIFTSCHAEVNDMVTNVKVSYKNGGYVVTWDEVDGASEYIIYRITESSSTSTTGTSTSTTTTYNLENYKTVFEPFCTFQNTSYVRSFQYCIGAIVGGEETFLSEKFSLR